MLSGRLLNHKETRAHARHTAQRHAEVLFATSAIPGASEIQVTALPYLRVASIIA